MKNYEELLTKAGSGYIINGDIWYLKTNAPQKDDSNNTIIALLYDGEFSIGTAIYKDGTTKMLSTRELMDLVEQYCQEQQLEKTDLQDPQRIMKNILYITEYLVENGTEVSKHTYSIESEKLYNALSDKFLNEFDFLNTIIKLFENDLPQVSIKVNDEKVYFGIIDSVTTVKGGMHIKINDMLFKMKEIVG